MCLLNDTIHFLLDCVCNRIFRSRTTIYFRHCSTHMHVIYERPLGTKIHVITIKSQYTGYPVSTLYRHHYHVHVCTYYKIMCLEKKVPVVRPWWNYTHADRVAAASRWRGHFDLWLFLSWHPPRVPTPSARSSGGHPPRAAATVAGMLIVHFPKEKTRWQLCAFV